MAINLFGEEGKASDFSGIKPQDIKDLTGVQPTDLRLEEKNNPEQALDDLLNIWIDRIASHIHVRIGEEIPQDDKRHEAVIDILVRTIAKLIAVGQQQRTSPVVQLGEFAVSIINTSQVTKDLKQEIRPYRKRQGKVHVYASSGDIDVE